MSVAKFDVLILQAEELANAYNYDGHPSIFQTTEQVKQEITYLSLRP